MRDVSCFLRGVQICLVVEYAVLQLRKALESVALPLRLPFTLGVSMGSDMDRSSWYSRFAKVASHFCGRPRVFVIAVAVIVVWVVTGPLFHFSDTWQLVINTGTTIVTFLMVFLIQNTQTRDTEAIQIKLDELIRSTKGAHNALLDLEELEDEHIDAFRAKYEALASSARAELKHGIDDMGTPEP